MSAVPISSAVPHRTLSTRITDPHAIAAAVSVRRDHWLAQGLCTRPSDRPSAESAVAGLYRRAGFEEPEFVWVPSPPAALQLIADESLSVPPLRFGKPAHPSAGIAALWSASRDRMDARILRRHRPGPLVRAAVWDSLRTSLYVGVATAIRTLWPRPTPGVTWYGQQEAHRVAYYDTLRRFGLASFESRDDDLLDLQAALVRATGWWWAFDGVCVMAERPTAVHTEPTPEGVHNERRLHHPDRPALEFSDGSHVFVQHGTIVPDWVVLDPTVERINDERNVEVRRCAVERIGWDRYIDMAALALVDHADDPGNPGCTLGLYASPTGWGRPGRILLVVNGSVERDGQRRRYGLHVPEWVPSALDAAGWTYGISGTDYAQLVRRT
ncbi:DUF6745 domain-containing protein [Rhodococcus aetherivorans]|uniref:DUF6745 domain-containing protein n=1 Tax=Rhodococcus aetherivorans TaxID=191292 RepID=UPI00367319BA